MEVGDVLSVQGLVDGELAGDGVDDEDAGGGLVGTRSGHAVAEGAVLVVVRADLWEKVNSVRIIYMEALNDQYYTKSCFMGFNPVRSSGH